MKVECKLVSRTLDKEQTAGQIRCREDSISVSLIHVNQPRAQAADRDMHERRQFALRRFNSPTAITKQIFAMPQPIFNRPV